MKDLAPGPFSILSATVRRFQNVCRDAGSRFLVVWSAILEDFASRLTRKNRGPPICLKLRQNKPCFSNPVGDIGAIHEQQFEVYPAILPKKSKWGRKTDLEIG
jgi:hypothetical protein